MLVSMIFLVINNLGIKETPGGMTISLVSQLSTMLGLGALAVGFIIGVKALQRA